jgi:hypothetical protein
LFFGAGGTWLDPLLPVCILGVILVIVQRKSARG